MPPACRRRPSKLEMNVIWAHPERFLRGSLSGGGRTQHYPLSAPNAKNRVGNAQGGPKRRFRHAHTVIEPFVTLLSHTLTQRANRNAQARSFE